tara:strand:- start:1084 stop:2088 length:1005 start_codon:yes stop_codon:yes gene_type:complete
MLELIFKIRFIMKKSVLSAVIAVCVTGGVSATSISYDDHIKQVMAERFAEFNAENPDMNAKYGDIHIMPSELGQSVVIEDVSFEIGVPEAESGAKVTIGSLSFTDGLQNKNVDKVPLKGKMSFDAIKIPYSLMLDSSMSEDEKAIAKDFAGEDEALRVDLSYQYDMTVGEDTTGAIFYGAIENVGDTTVTMNITGLSDVGELQGKAQDPNAAIMAMQGISVTDFSMTATSFNMRNFISSMAKSDGMTDAELLADMVKVKKEVERHEGKLSAVEKAGSDFLNAALVAYSEDKQVMMDLSVSEPLNFMSVLGVMSMQNNPDGIMENLGISVDFSVR